MLELVGRKASGISWPGCRAENLDTFGKRLRDVSRRRADKHADCTCEKQWKRDSKGLLCSLGQLGCNDSYSPDTLGTWKFHKVSRARVICFSCSHSTICRMGSDDWREGGGNNAFRIFSDHEGMSTGTGDGGGGGVQSSGGGRNTPPWIRRP
ncbi:hypothetical protein EAI_12866 [Harpegnathos saltator]|uniref:Uncharacterized protein n=1 Tax=Harpegnathos saltator TaxID=610380 RepID=E2BTJ1_HARSA|nr:hypothetical protein EAI_12866 [Harpegnathos saltator]